MPYSVLSYYIIPKFGAHMKRSILIKTDCVEKLHTQFYKYYFGFRAPNVASPNEAGRLSLKSKIYENILKFWIHLENLPENSIAYQCLQISKNLAMFSSKTCFISSVNKIVDLFQARNQQNTNVNLNDKDDSSKWLIDMKRNSYRTPIKNTSNQTYKFKQKTCFLFNL